MTQAAPVAAGLLAAACVVVLLLPADTGRLARALRGTGGRRDGQGQGGVQAGGRRVLTDATAGPWATGTGTGRGGGRRRTPLAGRSTVGGGPAGAVAPERLLGLGGRDRGAGRRTAQVPPATAACLLAGVAVALLLPLPLGPLLGLLLVVAGPRALARLESRSAREHRQRLLHELPLVLDLLASCLAGGAPLPVAADAVARAVGGPAGARLAAVGAALLVGTSPSEAWGLLAGADPAERDTDPLAPAARALARAADGGAPVAAAVSRLAADARADARSRGEQAARRVGVLAVAPLGLCFLPAFVLLGVVPVVVGLAGPLLAGL